MKSKWTVSGSWPQCVCVCVCGVVWCGVVCVCVTFSCSTTVHGEVCGLVGLQAAPLHPRAEHLHLAGVAAFPNTHLRHNKQHARFKKVRALVKEICLWTQDNSTVGLNEQF